MGESAFPMIQTREWASDSSSWSMGVKLEPNKDYKFWITSNFRNKQDIPLLPYLIEFKTGKE